MSELRRRILLAAAAFLAAAGGRAAADPALPRPTDWVVDQAGLFTPAERVSLAQGLASLERETTAEFAVLTISALPSSDTIETYAQRVFDEWKIGKKNKDNGLLLVISLSPRRVRLHVGYGLEGVLTDGTAGELLDRQAIPSFRRRQYGEGCIALMKAVHARLQGRAPSPPTRPAGFSLLFEFVKLGGFFLLLVAAVVINLFSFVGGDCGRRGGGFGGGSSGGFGGYGGGSSGGGGASRGF